MKSHRVELPDCQQETDATCGAACVRSILMHEGIDRPEDDLARELRTRRDGCDPVDLARVLRRHRVRIHEQRGMSEEALMASLARGWPVILGLRDHWVVATGFDARGVTVMDPWAGPRTIAWPTLAATWADVEGRPARPLIRYGLVAQIRADRTRAGSSERARRHRSSPAA